MQNPARPSIGFTPVVALPLTQSGPLFFPPSEILEAIARKEDPAAGTGRLLIAAMERLKDPELANPPFSFRA